ncbi:hypothetical protein [Caulobacter sp. DWR3-1-2]|uniref:hypothetical protein n=1 Tax=Caulobacter sp. DWR3-1-2 TaxID=2804647 RepID=UPI003CEA7A4B
METPHLVSLGGFCQVAFQLKRIGLKACSPYDKLITPWGALIKSLKDKAYAHGVYARPWKGSVRSGDILYHHDFPSKDGVYSTTLIHRIICQAKIARRTRMMDGLTGEVIFFRLGATRRAPFTYVYTEDDGAPTVEDFDELSAVLDQRFPQLRWRLVYAYYAHLSPAPAQLRDRRISVHALRRPRLRDPSQWQGDNGQWDEIFDLALGRPSRAFAA